MPTTYTKADRETQALIEKTMEKYHGGHTDAGVTVQVLMAYPPKDEDGEPTGPALKHRGLVALAMIRTTKLEERTLGAADLEIKLDADNWEVCSQRERVALIDHELTHKPLRVDGNGNIVRDNLDRPKFATREHDREYGWFDCIAYRHGAASAEARQAHEFLDSDTYRQSYLPGFETITAG